MSIVVLNWNGEQAVRTCLPSLCRLDYPAFEIIFVDNGSHDNSVTAAREIAGGAGRELVLVENRENLGYNRGKNAGAARASGKYLWLLDNDIEAAPDALRTLVDHMERHPRLGLCGPLLRNRMAGDAPEGSGMLFLPGGAPFEIQKVRRGFAGVEPVLVGTVLGGTALVRRDVWEYIGGYEPSSVFSMNDVDLGPRVWCAGWAVAMVPGAVVYHHAFTRASKRKTRWRFTHYAPGVVRGMLRNFRLGNLLLALPLFFGLLLLKTAKRAVAYRDPLFPFFLLPALYNTARQLPASLGQRRRVQALRRVPEDRFLHPERYAHILEETDEQLR